MGAEGDLSLVFALMDYLCNVGCGLIGIFTSADTVIQAGRSSITFASTHLHIKKLEVPTRFTCRVVPREFERLNHSRIPFYVSRTTAIARHCKNSASTNFHQLPKRDPSLLVVFLWMRSYIFRERTLTLTVTRSISQHTASPWLKSFSIMFPKSTTARLLL